TTGSDVYGNVLCVSNFHTNAGYAWHFIESLYAAVANDLAEAGLRTFVAYPRIDDPPASLDGSHAEPIELALDLGSPGSIARAVRLVRRHDIRTLYLSDRPPWHPAYVALRAAGLRTIIVHDHTSGDRTRPQGVKRLIKSMSRRLR